VHALHALFNIKYLYIPLLHALHHFEVVQLVQRAHLPLGVLQFGPAALSGRTAPDLRVGHQTTD
jgi:hypothetical protein